MSDRLFWAMKVVDRLSVKTLLPEVAILLALCWSCQAESRLSFPRVSFHPNEITGLAIVNPNSLEASVTLTAYGADGTLLQGEVGFQNPAVVVIGAGEQFARLPADVFGPATGSPIAWVEAVSPSDYLTGFFLYLVSPAVDVFDGADMPRGAKQLIFPEIRFSSDFSTELSLVNPGEHQSTVNLQLLGETITRERQLVLPSKGVARLDVADFFDLDPAAEPVFVKVEADQDLLGFEFVKGEGDWLGLNAQLGDELLETLNFPQMAVRGLFQSEVTLVNLSDQDTVVSLLARNQDGELFGLSSVQKNPVSFLLRAGGIVREDLAELFGFSDQGQEGWLQVRSGSQTVAGSLTYSIPSIRSLASVAPIAQASTRAVFSHIATSLGFFTGVALLNPGGLSANYQVVALTPSGQVLGSFSSVLQPGARVSKLIDELVPQAAGQSGGLIWVNSSIPLYLTSLFGNLDSGVLANVPPQPVPRSFRPDSGGTPLDLTPPLAVVEPLSTQHFSLLGSPEGEVDWKINGSKGGNETLGTITEAGIYMAPGAVPPALPLTVSAATSDGQAAGASIDVLTSEGLVTNLGELVSISYLENLQRLFVAEAIGLSGSGRLVPSGGTRTLIRELVGDTLQTLIELDGEEVVEMVPFRALDENEYLLLVAGTSGQVLRLDPVTAGVTTVVSGLNDPISAVFDQFAGELFISEADQLSIVSLDVLSSGLGTILARQPSGSSGPPQVLFRSGPGRAVVDECTGNVYSITFDGKVIEFVRQTGAVRLLLEGLANPGRPLGLFRNGVACPESFHILVSENRETITLVIPSERRVIPWLRLDNVTDLEFLPDQNPITPRGGILLSRQTPSGGKIAFVPFSAGYRKASDNPPTRPPRSGCAMRRVTDLEGSPVPLATMSRDGSLLFFVSDADLVGENPDLSHEIFSVNGSGEIEQVTRLQAGEIFALDVNLDGSSIAFVSDAVLTAPDPPGANLFLLNRESDDLTALPGLLQSPPSIDHSGNRVVFAASADPFGQNPEQNVEIFFFDRSSGGRQLTVTGSGSSSAPQISGNGQVVFFRSRADVHGLNPDGAEVLFRMEIEGGATAAVAELALPGDPALSSPLLVNTIGSRVLLESRVELVEDAPAHPAFYLYNSLDGNFRYILTSAAGSTRFNELDDSGTLAVATSVLNQGGLNRDRNREVFLLNLNTGQSTQLTRSIGAVNLFASIDLQASILTFLSNAGFTDVEADESPVFDLYRAECNR